MKFKETGSSGLQAGSAPERSLQLFVSGPFAYPLLVRGPEELGDGVWLPRSFMVLHTSSDFYFGTHKGQSQSLLQEWGDARQEQLGSPAPWVPLTGRHEPRTHQAQRLT